jgi:hypothetical protein
MRRRTTPGEGMAKIDVLHTPKDGSFLFYNLDAGVGKGGVNSKDDVLLVQYLLKTSADVPGKFQALVGGAVKQLAGVWTDYDDMMLGMVQNHWRDKGTSTWQDRRVDPAPGNRTHGRVHHTQYKIITLNIIYQYVRPAVFPRIAEVTDCPGELRPLIRAPGWLK